MKRKLSFRSKRLRQQRRRRIKNILAFGLGLCLGGAGYWFLFFTPFFQIYSLDVQGGNDLIFLSAQNYLQQKTSNLIPSSLISLFPSLREYKMNFLSFSSSALEDFLLKKYPILSTASVNLDIVHHILTIQCIQRNKDFYWCSKNGECFLVDKTGKVFQKASLLPKASERIVHDERNRSISLGDTLFTVSQGEMIEKIFDLANNQNSPFTISYLEVTTDDFSSLHLVTNSGWFLIFSLSDDFSHIQNIVKMLEAKQLKGRMKDLRYIDCRYLPKIYYHLR